MALALTGSVAVPVLHSRWAVAYVWLAGLIAYCVALLFGDALGPDWINDIVWTLSSASAALVCFRVARSLRGELRTAWLLIGTGCALWFIGQLHWDYSRLVLGMRLPFPSINQLFYSAFPLCVIAGVLRLREPGGSTSYTFRHFGNIGLVSCCLAATVLLGIVEPALQANIPKFYLAIALAHTLAVAATFLAALYALWTFRWTTGWMPVLLVVIGTGLYSVSNLIYAHALITQTYLPNDLVNLSWPVVFGVLAAAAWEQRWLQQHPQIAPPQRMQARERWLEAIVPALLMIIMVVVAVGSGGTLTPRVLTWAGALFILFAILLGAREAWIQRESQRLTDALVETNEQLQAANAELRLSETRYRTLATELEQRVAERTSQLKSAYDELEGFSYAVAHDLKAPLRAVNGFAQLLEEEVTGELGDRGRDYLDRIRNGSLKMATLIDDLLSYSHIERRGLHVSTINLQTLLDSVVAQYRDEIVERAVEVTVDAEALLLRVDVEGLSLALRNLLENALKYTRDTARPTVRIDTRRQDGQLTIRVADNGIGFDMQYHDHIFKVFQRLHRDAEYPGTGIGLALVRKAVERIGGRVWATSSPGEGATFYIELPKEVVVR